MKLVAGALLAGLAGMALTSTTASAAVVCNREGDCWRVKNTYKYKPAFGLRVYGDNWKWNKRHDNKYRWREAGGGRGYWSKGIWIQF